MVLYSLNIINKDGGLIYHREFVRAQGVDLRLASSFHVMHAIASQIAPVDKSSGIEEFVAEAFKLQCMQTRTGVKFFFIADVNHSATAIKRLLQKCYECYVDYVLKNPFYSLEQPIRVEKFDFFVAKLVKESVSGA